VQARGNKVVFFGLDGAKATRSRIPTDIKPNSFAK
jgi:hypothetical protein